ncbi:Tmco6 [Phodopus roborovskii]|uniref:Tmco6 protein n=1 Tax=Phodopus roborovskii TaxID=109678 RepID=A0AAV0A3L7_PHORO|nr:Tmco6 [Phodopus roborovskii]
MWSRRQGHLRTLACGVEELRCRRREREAALRKARREQQLVSKRLLREDAPEEAGGQSAPVLLGEAEVRGQGDPNLKASNCSPIDICSIKPETELITLCNSVFLILI